MILRASAKCDENTFDQDGDNMGGAENDAPVETLARLLRATSAAHASNLLNAMLRDELECSVLIPQSTVVSIRTGALKWMQPQVAEAFSIFSCGPSSAIRITHMEASME